MYKFRSLLSWLKGRGGEVVTIELPTKALKRKFMQKGVTPWSSTPYTIDLFNEGLIPIPEYVNRLKKVAKRQIAK